MASSFWSKVWDKRPPVPSSQREKFLEGYRKQVDPSLCSKPDLDLVLDIIKRPNSSAPGPDGIPFAAGGPSLTLLPPSYWMSLMLLPRGGSLLMVLTMVSSTFSLRRKLGYLLTPDL